LAPRRTGAAIGLSDLDALRPSPQPGARELDLPRIHVQLLRLAAIPRSHWGIDPIQLSSIYAIRKERTSIFIAWRQLPVLLGPALR
jgi:hypothetical protein